ncbi:hypothetical protein [Streptomyces sp. NPDC001068]|uniref:hypothetical protein n=1 Tax=Streptomyces sp. NPDC001068 TaxID=3364544 RepID=UPI003695696C
MFPDTAAHLAVQERSATSVERLGSLLPALAEDLGQGRWTPGPLERTLAARLVVACAGDGRFTPVRVRETLLEGSVALLYAGGGRFARLLARLIEVTGCSGADADAVLTEALALVERVARNRAPEDEEQ